MNNQAVANELVAIAKLLSGKGEVPEAFKKQWKKKDKDNDGKTNEPKPDFLKKKAVSQTAAKGKKEFRKVAEGKPFKYKNKTYWKASRTRACLQSNMVRIRQDEPVEEI